jgi:transcriptional regulator with XRE-family HTH domain
VALPRGKFQLIMEIVNLPLTLKELRKSKGLSRRAVAVELDIADSTVLRWEKGTREPHMSLGTVKKLLKLFNCDFDTLHDAFEETRSMKELLDNGYEWIQPDEIVYERGEPEGTEEEEGALLDSVPIIRVKDRLG